MVPTIATSAATPAATTSTIARACAHRRLMSRKSLISRARIGSPAQLGRGPPRCIFARSGYPTIAEKQHTMGDVLDAGIVGDDECSSTKLRVDAQQGFDHLDASF